MTGAVPDRAGDEVPVRDAATVVLLRDGADGIESWLLSRRSSMVFAAGMTVFPGGRIEDSDADVPVTGTVAPGFGGSPGEARALVGGAAREVFEETGVLLSTPSADLGDVRAEVEAGRVFFASALSAAGAAVDASLFVPWSRWVTPAGEVRRYDTRFFLAALPPGAQAADVTSEASAAAWVSVTDALDGTRAMLPPTAVTLATLRPFVTVAAALAAAGTRDLSPVRPTLTRDADGALLATLPTGESVRLPS